MERGLPGLGSPMENSVISTEESAATLCEAILVRGNKAEYAQMGPIG
jgi:hypothetical protein